MDLDHGLDHDDVQRDGPFEGMRKSLIEQHVVVSRTLVNSIIDALGFDPAEVRAISFDHYTVVVLRPNRPPWRLIIID